MIVITFRKAINNFHNEYDPQTDHYAPKRIPQ